MMLVEVVNKYTTRQLVNSCAILLANSHDRYSQCYLYIYALPSLGFYKECSNNASFSADGTKNNCTVMFAVTVCCKSFIHKCLDNCSNFAMIGHSTS